MTDTEDKAAPVWRQGTAEEGVGIQAAITWMAMNGGDAFFGGKDPPLASIGANMIVYALFLRAGDITMAQAEKVAADAGALIAERIHDIWGKARDFMSGGAEAQFAEMIAASRALIAEGRTVDSFITLVEAGPRTHAEGTRTVTVLPKHALIMTSVTPGVAETQIVPIPPGQSAAITAGAAAGHQALALVVQAEHIPYVLSVLCNNYGESARAALVERCLARVERTRGGKGVH